MSSRDSGTITNLDSTSKIGYIRVESKKCMSAVYLPYIYIYPLFTSLYIGEVNSGHDFFNFNLMYTKFYADFRSGLRFGCYQRTISRYVICLASEATCPRLQWDLILGSRVQGRGGVRPCPENAGPVSLHPNWCRLATP